MQQLKRGLSEADQEIADRLEKLREDRKQGPVPSDVEIQERLAKLRGESFSGAAPKVIIVDFLLIFTFVIMNYEKSIFFMHVVINIFDLQTH